jgi:hypothetical protein
MKMGRDRAERTAPYGHGSGSGLAIVSKSESQEGFSASKTV